MALNEIASERRKGLYTCTSTSVHKNPNREVKHEQHNGSFHLRKSFFSLFGEAEVFICVRGRKVFTSAPMIMEEKTRMGREKNGKYLVEEPFIVLVNAPIGKA